MFIKETHLRCDGEIDNHADCEINIGVDGMSEGRSAKYLRVTAKSYGWSQKGTEDWCPACNKRRLINEKTN
jgi:hypothetical protein